MKLPRRRALLAVVAVATGRALAQDAHRPPRWLTIAIRQDRPPIVAENVRGPNAAVVTDSRSASASTGHDGAYVTRARASERSFRVLEGGRALIQFDAAVPMTFRQYTIDKQGVNELLGLVSYDALAQFIVSPRVAGAAVTLEIEPQDGSILTESGARGRLLMTARGRLGEWIAVGGADLREENGGLELHTATQRAQTRPTTDQRGVWLKVDIADGAR